MSPYWLLFITEAIKWIANNSETVIELIQKRFASAREDPEVISAVQELGFEPTQEKVAHLHKLLKEKGEPEADKLVDIVLNRVETEEGIQV